MYHLSKAEHDVSAGVAVADREPPEVQIDVRRVVSVLRRYRVLMVLTSATVLILALVAILSRVPEYTATSSVAIEPRQEEVTKVTSVLSRLPDSENIVESEVAIIRSQPVVASVVTSLGLVRDPEFNGALRPPGPIATALRALSGPKPPADASAQFVGTQSAVADALTVSRVGLTYVIEIKFASRDPAKAARIATAFANAYLEQQVSLRNNANERANKWLGGRLAGLRDQVLAAESAVQQYRIANNLLSSSGVNLTEQEISELNKRLAEAQTAQAESDARLSTARSQIRSGNRGDELGEALQSPVIQQLREQRAEATQKVASAELRYGPKHPDYQRAVDEEKAIDQQIQAELDRIIANLKAQAAIASQRTGSVQASLGAAHSTLVSNNRADVRLNELERNAQSARTRYEGYLERYRETTSQAGLTKADARLLAPANVPYKPSSARKLLLLVAAVLVAGIAGLLAVVIRQLLDTSLATTEDVERQLSYPALGTVPLLASTGAGGGVSTSPVREIVEHPLSVYSEAFRALRTAAVQPVLDRDGKAVVAFTSALPGEGKTTSSICLARSLALSGVSVVLLDADLHRRSSTQALQRTADTGLVDVVSGRATLQQSLVQDDETPAMLLFGGNVSERRDVFATDAFRSLIAELKRVFDVIIIDTPPVLAIADARTLAGMADVTIHVAHWRKTPRQAIRKALTLLEAGGAIIKGVALTRVDLREQAKSGYGDANYYFNSYKTYYHA